MCSGRMTAFEKTNIMRTMDRIDLKRVNLFTLRKHHLTEDSRIDDIVKITDDISGLHATGIQEPYLALFARTTHFIKEQLDRELYINKTLGKIRCMRGTLHILTKQMIPVAYAATRPMVEKLSRRYAEFRGIVMQEYQGISDRVLELLKSKEMTAAEIKSGLKTKLHMSAILNLMCDQGLLLRVQHSNDRGARNYRYAIFQEHFSDVGLVEFSEAKAITRLVADYLRSFGPATETDIAWWVGLGKTKIRQALAMLRGETARLSISELDDDYIILHKELHLLADVKSAPKPIVNLLPHLDPYLMGYKRRGRYLRPEYFDRVFDSSGNATATILVDGKVAGVWDLLDETKLKICLFEDIGADVRQQLYLEAHRLGQFMAGKTVEVTYVSSMRPLTRRTAGGFMSPLKNSR